MKREKLTCTNDIAMGTSTCLPVPNHIVDTSSGGTRTTRGDKNQIRYKINESIWRLFGAKPIVITKIPRASIIAEYVIKDLELKKQSDAVQEDFWDEWGEKVYKMMRNKKNYVTTEIKKKMIGKL